MNTWNTSNYPIATNAYSVCGCMEGNTNYTIDKAEGCNTSRNNRTSFKWTKIAGNYAWIFVIGTT